MVDHINGNGLDNRKENLRHVTCSVNTQNRNRGPMSKSGYRGVVQCRDKPRWYAKIKVKGKTIHIGTYDCKIKAAKAYDLAALKYFGEGCFVNFPESSWGG